MASPAFAPPDVKDVTLALFAGRKTDITPSDIPEGLTPDEQDGVYLPGGWFSRPGLAKLFATGQLTAGTQVLYEKTYVQPNGDPLNLMLTSDGTLWVEDVGNNPGNPSSLASVAPGLYAQSVSEFGREYLAFSDLLHGQGIPLQYDGTFLDRVTMDGPGAGPDIENYQPPSATIVGSGSPVNISNIQWVNPISGPPPQYLQFQVATATAHGLAVGQSVIIVGANASPSVNGGWRVFSVPTSTVFLVTFVVLQSSAVSGGAAGTVSPQGLVRSSNVVQATTTAAHGFQPGWQVQISGVANTNIGGGIASISRDANGVVTVTTSGNHGIPVTGSGAPSGTTIAIAGVTNPDNSFNGTFPVQSVLSSVSFTYQQGGTVEASSAGSGNVQDIWNTTAFIESVPSTTTFTYQQIGPSDGAAGGTATIIGQISPGQHNFVVMWLTRQGAIPAPSPAVSFIANGGQQILLTKLPIGPANVVARLIGATGAGGDNYFTIPAVPQVGGMIVGTSLVIPDNTSTSVILDFSDNTLFAAIPIDQIGNDLFDQVVLGPVLGFFAYASRLDCWGDYNKVENFLNTGFCGGYLAGVLTAPLGWNAGSNVGGTLVNGGSWTAGMSWRITGDGSGNKKGLLTQSAYQDSFGDAIISPSTQYSVRFWAKASAAGLAGNYFIVLSSVSASFTATAQIAINTFSTAGALTPFATFNLETPATIPADLLLSIYEIGLNNAATIVVAEHEFIFTDNPYRDNQSRWSYVENPEAFAQSTGNLGPEDDTSPMRCFALLRQSSLLETAEGVHIFEDNTSEPGDWNVNQLTRAIGAASLRGGDPGKFGTGDAAEDWAVVAGKNGVYLFAGAQFWKVSQEVSRGTLPQTQDPRKCWEDINWQSEQTIVAKNDPASRRAYFAVPINGAASPNVVFALDYREMDTAQQIAAAPPLHITIQGKMKSSDLTRKWSVWNVAANDIEILVRPQNQRQLFFAGGAFPGGASYGNIYSLNPASLHDDDYGQIFPYYTTYAFTDHDQEQILGLGADSKLVKQVHAFVTGVGQVIITPIVNSLYNFKPSLSPRTLVGDTDPSNFLADDLEWTIAGLRGDRIFFRVSVIPLPGAIDVQVRLQKFIVHMMKDPVAAYRQSGV